MPGKQRRLTEERLPPYVSYRSWQKLLAELTTHVPPLRFDSSFFDELSITGSNRSMLQGTLLYLGLMSPDCVPTEKLQQLVKAEGEKRQALLEGIVRQAYKPLFTKLDITRATQAQIEEYYESKAISGDIRRKCLSFFFAITTEANIPLSPHLRQSSARGRGKRAGADEMTKLKAGKSTLAKGDPAWEKLLLEKIPDFNVDWTDEVKKKWFDAIKWLIKTLEMFPPASRKRKTK